MTRRRLDAELVRRGLVTSRAEAQAAVRKGLVTVSGAPATKVAALVDGSDPLRVAATVRRFASRGGDKLAAALERFAVDPTGRDCLDAGASTGGFTDRLLQGGALRLIAVDVGYGQLAWRIRNDPRVIVMERTNVKDLRRDALPFPPDLVVADLSFISLRRTIPVLVDLATPDAEFVVLIKPQFEAGRGDVGRGGVVRDAAVRRRVIREVVEVFEREGVAALGVMASPLLGPAGNVEFLLHARRGAVGGGLDVDAAVCEGEAIGR